MMKSEIVSDHQALKYTDARIAEKSFAAGELHKQISILLKARERLVRRIKARKEWGKRA